MICWYCFWGWPKQVADIYCEALAALDGCDSLLLYGPGHIVWSDENWDSAQWCLDHFEEYWGSHDPTPEEKRIVRESLEKLLLVPEEIRMCEPDDYDGEHPENFPPPAGIEMVKL
jgi:hypothetical protein